MKLSIDTYGNVLAENAKTLTLNGFALSCGTRNEEAIENTRHIVHCVNSHDELVRQRDELRAATQSLINALMPLLNRENTFDFVVADVLRALERCK